MSDALWYLADFALVVFAANGLVERIRLARRVGWWADGVVVTICWAVLLLSGVVLLVRTLWARRPIMISGLLAIVAVVVLSWGVLLLDAWCERADDRDWLSELPEEERR